MLYTFTGIQWVELSSHKSTLTDPDIRPPETQYSGVAAELVIFSSTIFFIKVTRNDIIFLEWPSDLILDEDLPTYFAHLLLLHLVFSMHDKSVGYQGPNYLKSGNLLCPEYAGRGQV
jgi:hypothetical protein